jgi:hypothetical protein
MKTFVTDISASTGRNDFIFDIWLWHGDLYHVSPFQAYRTSTSCLPRNECWDIYKFDTNEWVGVFLARRSVQHLVTHRCRITYTGIIIYKGCHDPMVVGCTTMFKIVLYITDCAKSCHNFHSNVSFINSYHCPKYTMHALRTLFLLKYLA